MTGDESVLAQFPGAAIDHDNFSFFQGLLEQRLLLNRCDDCGHWHHPPSPTCPSCWSHRLTPTPVRGAGIVQLQVTVRHPVPIAGLTGPGPHRLVTVELEEQPGLRFTAPAEDPRSPELPLGCPVEITWVPRNGVALPAVRAAD
jgi:uncharacterized OB-fold protein